MTRTPLDAVEALLERLLAQTDDAETQFTLRTALQLVVVARDEHDRAAETLEAADLDDDLREHLQELGYLD